MPRELIPLRSGSLHDATPQHIVLGDLNAVTPRLQGRPDGYSYTS